MNDLVNVLENLALNKRLCPAEQIIMRTLIEFEQLSTMDASNKNGADDERIEDLLLKLLRINRGELSMPCSIRIGSCFVRLCRGASTRITEKLLAAAHKRASPAILYATGFVIEQSSECSEASLAKLVMKLATEKVKLIEPVLFVLNACFKHMKAAKDVEPAYMLAKNGLASSSVVVQLLSARLLRTVASGDSDSGSQALEIVKSIDLDDRSLLVISEMSHIIAKLAVVLSSVTGENVVDGEKAELFGIRNSPDQLEQVFCILQTVPRLYVPALERFLAGVSLDYIHVNLDVLFELIREKSVMDLPILFAYLSTPYLMSIYETVIKEDPSKDQIRLMKWLRKDDDALKEIGSLALHLVTKSRDSSGDPGTDFFRQIAMADGDTARAYLRAMSVFLDAPYASPNINREIKVTAMMAAEMIGVDPELAESVRDTLTGYVERSLSMKYWNAHFAAAFILLTVLPDEYFSLNLVEKTLNDFAKYCEECSVMESMQAKMKIAASAIALFIRSHPEADGAARTLCAIYEDNLDSPVVDICVLIAFAGMQMSEKHSMYLAQKIRLLTTAASPRPGVVQSCIESLMKSPDGLVNGHTSPVQTEIPKIFEYVQPDWFVHTCIELYPDIVLKLSAETGTQYVSSLLSHHMAYPTSPSLLLSLVQDDRTWHLIPTNVHQSIISLLERSGDDHVRAQILAECLGLWARSHPELMPQLQTCVDEFEASGYKCLAYLGIFYKCQLSDEFIINAMHSLNAMALTTDTTVYALYALKGLYQRHAVQLAMMPLVSNQCTFFATLVNCEMAMHPHVLYYLAHAFHSLVAIVTPDLDGDRADVVPDLKIVIRAIKDTRVPFAGHTFNDVFRAVFGLRRSLVPGEPIRFPTSRMVSYEAKLSACGAISDMLRLNGDTLDYFDHVPDVLHLLQWTDDQRARDFVCSVALDFADRCNTHGVEAMKEGVVRWTKLLRLCNATGQLPGCSTVIAVSDGVRKCCLTVAITILPLIAQLKPLDTECVDDIMATVIGCVHSNVGEVLMEMFNCLVCVLETFGDSKTKEDDILMERYVSHFTAAVKVGFEHIEFSETFLLKYAELYTDDVGGLSPYLIETLDVFIAKLADVKGTGGIYENILAKVTSLAERNEAVMKKMEPFLPDICDALGAVLRRAECISMASPVQWSDIASFRTEYSLHYNDIVTSYVWLLSRTNSSVFPANELQQFMISELKNTTDSWRIAGAMTCITKLTDATEIADDELISKMKRVSESESALVSPVMDSFIEVCSRKLHSGSTGHGILGDLIHRYDIARGEVNTVSKKD